MPLPPVEIFTNTLPPKYSDWIKFYRDAKHVVTQSDEIVYEERSINLIKRYTISKAFFLERILESMIIDLSELNTVFKQTEINYSHQLFIRQGAFFNKYKDVLKP